MSTAFINSLKCADPSYKAESSEHLLCFNIHSLSDLFAVIKTNTIFNLTFQKHN